MIYDYIVIGSGFGGSVAGLRLVEKGYTVLILEQGKRYNPGDFPKTNWNFPKYLWVPALRFFGFQKLSFYSTASILSGTGGPLEHWNFYLNRSTDLPLFHLCQTSLVMN